MKRMRVRHMRGRFSEVFMNCKLVDFDWQSVLPKNYYYLRSNLYYNVYQTFWPNYTIHIYV